MDPDTKPILRNLTLQTTNVSFDTRDEDLALIEISVQVTILMLALLGNSFVLFALCRTRHTRSLSRVYIYMAHLSFADLLVAIFNILPQLIWDITFRFQGGDFLCRTIKYLQLFVLYLSTYILVGMAVDRFLAVHLMNGQWNSVRIVHYMIIMAWILSALMSLPQSVVFSFREVKPGVMDCWASFIEPWGTKAYVVWFVVSMFGIPVTVITVCYSIISWKIWKFTSSSGKIKRTKLAKIDRFKKFERCLAKKSNCLSFTRTFEKKQKSHLTPGKIKTIKLTFTVVVCFFVCWSPFCVTQLCLAFNPPENAHDVGAVQTIFLLLASLNSCTNPWIYLAFSGSLLNQLRLCCGLHLIREENADMVEEDNEEPIPDRKCHCQNESSYSSSQSEARCRDCQLPSTEQTSDYL